MIFYISYKGQRLSDLCACIPALSPNAMSQVKDPCSLQTRPRPTFPSITSSVFSSPSQTRIKHTNCFRAFLVLVFFPWVFFVVVVVLFQILKNFPRALWGAPLIALLPVATCFKDSTFFFFKGTIHTEPSTLSAEPGRPQLL